MAWRRVTFWVLVVVFLLMTPIVFLYASGYRWNSKSWRIEPTGSIYLKVSPSGTKIFLNGVLIKETSFLVGSSRITRLLPDTYTVRIEKQRFYSWEKQLEVKARETTSVPDVILIPRQQNILTSLAWEGKLVAAAFYNETGTLMATEEKRQGIDLHIQNEGLWRVLALARSTSTQEFILAPDASRLITKSLPNRWQVLNVEGAEPLILLEAQDIRPAQKLGKAFWVNDSLSFFSATDDGRLVRIDVEEKRSNEIARDILAAAPHDRNLIILTKSGRIKIINPQGQDVGRDLNQKLFAEENLAGGTFIADDDLVAFIDTTGKLFLLNPLMKEMILMAERSKGAHFSPNRKKILWWNESEVWVEWIQEELAGTRREKGRRELIGRFSQPIVSAFWYPGESYVLVVQPNKILAIELDSRDRRNTHTIFEGDLGDAFYNKNDEKLIIIGGKQLQEIAF